MTEQRQTRTRYASADDPAVVALLAATTLPLLLMAAALLVLGGGSVGFAVLLVLLAVHLVNAFFVIPRYARGRHARKAARQTR